MQATVGLRPHSARRKVYILGDADRLNEESSNCMLKTLEEPPSHTMLILLAPDEASVLPTIASRCLHVPLRPLSRTLVAASLTQVWSAEQEQADVLAALSGGRMGYAVSMLGDRDGMDKRRSALEKASLLMGATISDRINAATEFAKMFTDARADLYSMLDTWEAWWRDVLVVKAAAPELACNVDQMQTLSSVANRVPANRASAAVLLVQQTRQQLLENVNPRLALEALTLGLP
jgi:DNA polymerase-3 subunit delta'